jgi:hypothetical protein
VIRRVPAGKLEAIQQQQRLLRSGGFMSLRKDRNSAVDKFGPPGSRGFQSPTNAFKFRKDGRVNDFVAHPNLRGLGGTVTKTPLGYVKHDQAVPCKRINQPNFPIAGIVDFDLDPR